MKNTKPNPHFQYMDDVWKQYPASPGKKNRRSAGTVSTIVITKPKSKKERAAAIQAQMSSTEATLPSFIQCRRKDSIKKTTFKDKVKQQRQSNREQQTLIHIQEDVTEFRQDIQVFDKKVFEMKAILKTVWIPKGL